jgi:3-oxoacyl-[acyl-carrier protein] reductase
LLETAIGDWQRMFDTHVFGAVRMIKTFTPPMLEQRRGSIINIGSGGWAGQARNSREMPYKAAKAALANLTFYVAHELAPHNIVANLLLPGHTRSTGSDEQEAARAEIRVQLNPARPPVRPLRLKPDHVVPLALFLAQQDASGVTGQEIRALQWNSEHGHGGIETWGYEPDLEAVRTEGLL